MIGILTFHRGPNYGGFLQAWHLREAIRSLGYEATLVNYQGAKHHYEESVRWRGSSVKALKGFVHHYLKSRPFSKVVRELSDHSFENDAARISWDHFDKIVVGADVVWNFTHPHHGHDPVFFGAHPSQQATSFMAYAPSCGDTPAESDLPQYVRDGLKRFECINVRDEATATLVERAVGNRPPLVVDPTWLQGNPDVPCRKIPSDLKYALIYGQGATGQRARMLGEHCRQRGLKIVSAAFPCEATTHRLHSINPFEWTDLFRRAQCVVTSTFHGLLYAIKYNKPLIFMERPASRSKSSIAIDRCRLQERVVGEDQPFDPAHLDYCLDSAQGTEAPAAWIAESKRFLQNSL